MQIPSVAVSVVATLLLLLSAACSKAPGCEHHVRAAQISPDGKLKAAVLDVKCGAGAPDTNWVLLSDANAQFRDAADKTAVFEGAVERVSWRGADLVVIYGHAKPSKTADFAKGVKIYYLESEPPIDLGKLR
jgi:hypothetical protein